MPQQALHDKDPSWLKTMSAEDAAYVSNSTVYMFKCFVGHKNNMQSINQLNIIKPRYRAYYWQKQLFARKPVFHQMFVMIPVTKIVSLDRVAKMLKQYKTSIISEIAAVFDTEKTLIIKILKRFLVKYIINFENLLLLD